MHKMMLLACVPVTLAELAHERDSQYCTQAWAPPCAAGGQPAAMNALALACTHCLQSEADCAAGQLASIAFLHAGETGAGPGPGPGPGAGAGPTEHPSSPKTMQ